MAELEFHTRFIGPGVDDGRMDVTQLATSLLALAGLVREAHAAIAPGEDELTLDIAARTPGSFDVQLVLASLERSLTSAPVTSLANLISIVFGPMGALSLKRFRKGNDSDPQPGSAPGRVSLTVDGVTAEFEGAAVDLVSKRAVSSYIDRMLDPVGRDGVTEVEFKSDTVELVVDANEAADIATDTRLLTDANEPLVSHSEQRLTIDSVGLKPGLAWRFDNGLNSFPARIEDAAFNAKVARREDSFAAGDVLLCRLRLEQRLTDGRLSTSYTVERVLAHEVADRVQPQSLIDD